jgi:Mrp family chromosome partitioning ATPase
VRASAESDDGHASLDVIVAGAKAPNPVELLESQRMSDLLKEVESRYDLVIIDTPPTSVVSDAIPLLGQVTGVLVVSRLGSTTEGAATHLRGHLESLGAHPLGVVANGLTARRGDGGYGGYGYGYAYGYADRENDARPALSDSDPRSARDAGHYDDRELDLIRAADAVAAREHDR